MMVQKYGIKDVLAAKMRADIEIVFNNGGVFFFYDLLMTILYSYYRNRTAGHLFKNVIKNMISTKASPSCGGTRNEIKLNLISMYIAYYLNEFFGLYIIANAYIKIFLYRYRLVLKQIIR